MPPRTRRADGAQAPATPAKTKGTKRGATSTVATPQPKKQATSKAPKTGLSGTPAPNSSASLGRVDPASKLSGSILNVDGTVYDVMLNLVDISKNSDKYYVLQLVECTDGKLVVYTRWGRTGTSGSMQTEDFKTQEEAIAAFGKKFKAKTGVAWEDRDSYAPQAGKYEWAALDHTKVANMWSDSAKWQYWVDDGVAGKSDGWYDYEEEASAVVEQLFHEFTCNVHMYQRIVESGEYSYLVDLSKLQQTNVVHPAHTTRHIRRWTLALGNDQTPPGQFSAPALPAKRGKKAAATSAAPPSTPSKAQVKAQIKSQMQTPVKSQPAALPAMATPRVDPLCKLTTVSVYQDYNAVLNQTNLADGANNNKYYKIQLLEDSKLKSKNYFLWTHWGRVGEDGQSKLEGGFSLEDGITEFGKKFKSKTANAWENRSNFVHKAGKYDLVETEEGDDQAPAKTPVKTPAKAGGNHPPCKLDPVTQELVEFIFSEDMFNDALTEFDIDVQKMPLGSLSQAQVQKGYDVLLELDEAIKARDQKQITALTGRFYTVIPHSFGRQRPPLIDTLEKVKAKISMCDVLSDIETAQEMMKDTPAGASLSKHPTDELYDSLIADLSLLPPSNKEYKVAQQYFNATMVQKVKLLHVWTVGRNDEDNSKRKEFTKIGNHKLLWHGTNIAVVAAILKSGLRIMPHSGGRVGKGIYFASEHGKSSWYVSPGKLKGKHVGVMFLAEAALGKQSIIDQDDSSLKAPPKGFDSVLAKGSQEPDAKQDTSLTLEGIKVTVPQGKPVKDPKFARSSFSQSEYLVYNEKQQRLRYMLTFEW